VGSINGLGNGGSAIDPSQDVNSVSKSHPAQSSQGVAPTPAAQDQVQFEMAQVPTLTQAQRLEGQGTSHFHAVLSTAVQELRAAARETTDQFQAAYLYTLADKFQRLGETGEAPSNTTE